MRPTNLTLLISILAATTLAKVVCHRPPPEPSQIPRLDDCSSLIEDMFAISKLEDDEKYVWSRDPPSSAGSRKLPFRFQAPSEDNNCEFLVDGSKEDSEDTFSIQDVAFRARDVTDLCLEKEETVGAELVGPKRQILVILLKRILEPKLGLSGDGGSGENSTDVM